MRNLPRLIKIASQRIVRNPYNSIAAIFVMFLAFFISGVFVIITVGSNQLIEYFESRPQVTAFLRDGTSSDQVKEIQDKLNKTQVVSSSKYISKEEALKIYKERFKDDPILTEFVTADILPASIEVSTHKLEDLSQVAETLENETAVEEVVFQRNIVDTLQSWSRAVRNIGGGIIIFLLVTSFLTTLIVIGLNISIHKDEIEIMRLVGATSWYVRTPFIFEGIFYGVLSAVISTALIWIAFIWASPLLQSTFAGISILQATPKVFSVLFLGEITIGVLIGVVGSFVATRKYLNV